MSLGERAPRARLIRHAQASFGAADYDRLSPLGETQARQLGDWLAAGATRYAQVVRGSLRRHEGTLAAIEAAFAAAGRALPPARVDPDWNEVDHVPIIRAYAALRSDDVSLAPARAGDLRAMRELWTNALQLWREGGLDDAAPETWPAFGERIAAARARIGTASGTVLVVTSGGAMWRCAQAALDVDDAGLTALNLSLRNTGISEFERDDVRWRMLTWDEVPHLRAPGHEHLHSHY